MKIKMSDLQAGDVVVTNETMDTDSVMVCIERKIISVSGERAVIEKHGVRSVWAGSPIGVMTIRRV